MRKRLTMTVLVSLLVPLAVAGATGGRPSPPGMAVPRALSGWNAEAQDAPAQAAAGKKREFKTQEESDAFQALQNEKDAHQKISRAQAFLQQFPESEMRDVAYFQMMLGYHELNDRAKCIDAGHQAVQINPQFTYAYYNLGYEYLQPEPLDFDQGVWDLARATALARATQDAQATEIEKTLTGVYTDYHGSSDGLAELITQAGGSPDVPAGFHVPAPKLYGPKGVAADAVRQGGLGSCYFHSTVAAVARWNPKAIQDIITENGDGTFTVRFPDGKKVNVYAEDLRYGRLSRFDRSDGQWVGVLLRAYAQREVRETLMSGIEGSDMFALVKPYAQSFVESSDPLLLAYDRAIRDVVNQAGEIDKARMAARLKDEMKDIPVPDTFKDSLLKTLESSGVYDAVAGLVKQNGELFGAYRAVGNGGIPAMVMHNLFGAKAAALDTKSRENVAAFLSQAMPSKQPVVAATGGASLQALQAQSKMPQDADKWYVEKHAYTVTGYDPQAQTVTLRNPWGDHPDPDGSFTIPLATFADSFEVIQTVAN